jgi:hypothetical protein
METPKEMEIFCMKCKAKTQSGECKKIVETYISKKKHIRMEKVAIGGKCLKCGSKTRVWAKSPKKEPEVVAAVEAQAKKDLKL